MDAESSLVRSQPSQVYSNLEVIHRSNCLLVFLCVLGFFAFAVDLAIGMATAMNMAGFWLYLFILFGVGGVICWSVAGWQFHKTKRQEDEAINRMRAETRLLNKTATWVDAAVKHGGTVDVTRNDDKGITNIKVSSKGALQAVQAVSKTVVTEEKPKQLAEQAGAAPGRAAEARVIAQRKLIASIQVPTFAESYNSGLIGSGQKKILICHELETDEYTGELTGRLAPYQDELNNNCTLFLGGGSKSGKSTFMAHLSVQEALMGALFYCIDPHLIHPEKSIACKLTAIQHAFILPPAANDEDIKRVLDHAEHEAYCRVNGIETPYSGRPIVFIVDEALVLFGRAQRNPDDKELQKFYKRLALFMRDLGTAYNKFGMDGIFATQYLTKDAFKLPGGFNIDFRDACQNQTLLRLPPNQAQVMRLLQRSELQEMRTLRQGFGFMGFATGDIIRMAAGYISPDDIKAVASLVPPAPRVGAQFSGWSASGTVGRRASGLVVPSEYVNGASQRNTGELENGAFSVPGGVPNSDMSGLVVPSEPTPDDAPTFEPKNGDKLVPDNQHDDLSYWYGRVNNIRKACEKIGLSHRYERHASYILEQRGHKEKRS